MPSLRAAAVLAFATLLPSVRAQTELGAARITPNLAAHVDRPLRYHPEGPDFVITNGTEAFNRSLYGGNTAFRVDGGDQPEFVLYLPGRGGNLRLGVRGADGTKWLQGFAHVESRYRPGELRYELRDPLLGARGVVRVVALAYAETEGLAVRLEAENVAPGLEWVWAFGGVNGQRGKRDGDIGTEAVPISEWFQLQPRFCRGNAIQFGSEGFRVAAKPATLGGTVPVGAVQGIGRAEDWGDPAALLAHASAGANENPVVVGHVAIAPGQPAFVSLQRLATVAGVAGDLDVYQEAGATSGGVAASAGQRAPVPFRREELPARFAAAEAHFAALRDRVAVDTPDPFLNAAVGALNVAGDAVWDEPQGAIMHGAIAWRTRLLGWRGPYLLDALGWHERARRNFESWVVRQNVDPIPARVPPPDEAANLARNETGLHTNGDLSHSHYDMNLVFIDALFRHLEWTGDLTFARRVWPVIQRHLAWERRLFRREYGPERLPLYEAYAAIWASDDLQYSGGGTAHASAYNYFENRQAARLARLLGQDPAPYEREAELIGQAMRALLWVTPAEAAVAEGAPPATDAGTPAAGWFAENKDWLGSQRVHPDAALWTFYHTVDSGVPTPEEAWLMADRVAAAIPHLPVRGPGVPAGRWTLATSDWMPYDWSINNVVMAEAVHGALALWEAGRADEAWAVAEGSVLAAMYLGISPGNVGSMSYLDVYRRESQRDFADGGGVLSRAVVEGLFGVHPDALAGETRLAPGWPAEWEHATMRHPDFVLQFARRGATDRYTFEQRTGTARRLRLQLVARCDGIPTVRVNGARVTAQVLAGSVGLPRVEITAPAAIRQDVEITWAGAPVTAASVPRGDGFATVRQGALTWRAPPRVRRSPAPRLPASELGLDYAAVRLAGATFAPVALEGVFNDRVADIFRHEYRAPRSPFVSLALPKQGLGGWAGGVNRTATVDDRGLRSAAAAAGGRIVLPNGVPFTTPAAESEPNVAFVSQWNNFPAELGVALSGRARGIYLLLAGSTNPMQSRFENGVVTIEYADGAVVRLPLVNPTNWWPIEQNYFIDDFQFRRPEPRPIRLDLRTGRVRALAAEALPGTGGPVPGGAATVLALPLDAQRELRRLTIGATANDVVIGLLAATLVR